MRTGFSKRILALLLVLSLALGVSPAVYADEGNLGSGTPDGTPPVLERIELSATDVTAPGEIEVTAYVSDDVSGARDASLWFYCEETGKEIYCSLRSYDFDPELGEPTQYPEGVLKGTLEFDSFVESGSFYLNFMEIHDAAENRIGYHRIPDSDDPYWHCFPQEILDLRVNVTATEVTDSASPVLERIEFSATDVNAPCVIQVTVHATDDVSGLGSGSMWVYCEDLRKSLHIELLPGTYEWVDGVGEVFTPYPDGTLKGVLHIDKYVPTGSFYVNELYITDNAENKSNYDRHDREGWDDPYWDTLPQDILDLRINVTGSDTPDYEPPVLERIEMSVNTIAAPGEIEVTAYASDDVSGIHNASLWFISADAEDRELAKHFSCMLEGGTHEWVEGVGPVFTPYPDGILRGTLYIDQYAIGGSYRLMQIDIRDIAGNSRTYDIDASSDDPHWCQMPQQVLDFRFNILNAIPDVTTNIAKPEFVDEITNAKDDAYIKADFSGEAELPETAFDAIAGTDKTLDLVSDGVTWRFNGNDIVNDSKPIDLNVNISKLDEDDVPVADEISEKLDEAPAVVMKFAENGFLPGKATIQIKVDYAMREYLGASRELNVYYFNNQTGELELIAENLMVVNDTYVEFPITHCSYYVLTHAAAPQEHVHAPEKVEFMDATHEADGYEEHYACECGVLFADAEGTKTVTEEDIRIARYELGDVDHDHRLTSMDAMLLMQYKAGLLPVDFAFCTECADVDGKMGINSMDAMLILQFRAGLIESFR